MKTKLLIGSVASIILLGGVVSVNAISGSNANKNLPTETEVISIEKVEGDNNEIEAVSGTVLRDEQDEDHSRSQKYNGKITAQEAIAIATKDTPGTVVEVEFDDDGYYEVEIRTGTLEVEYDIDAYTGQILEKEVERDNMDDFRD